MADCGRVLWHDTRHLLLSKVLVELKLIFFSFFLKELLDLNIYSMSSFSHIIEYR